MKKEQSPKEWAEKIARVFGKKNPVGIELRGDGHGIEGHTYEIALIDLFHRSKQIYGKQGLLDNPKAIEHLLNQERTIYILAFGFDIDVEPYLSKSKIGYDLIPSPEKAESYYSTGFADKIFTSDMHDLPFLLDFQYFNQVKARKFDEVHFLNILKHYVQHYLKDRFPLDVADKREFLNSWIYKRVCDLKFEDQKKFYWYPEGFKWKDEGTDKDSHTRESGDSTHHDVEDTIPIMTEHKDSIDSKTGEQSIHSKSGNSQEIEDVETVEQNEPATFETVCNEQELIEYFDLLKQKNPSNKRPLLNDEAVDWMVGYYFGDRQLHTRKNKPKFEPNLSRKEIMFFIYQYSTVVSPGGKSDVSTPLKDTVIILCDCFSTKCKGTAKSYADSISRELKGFVSPITKMLIGKPAARLSFMSLK